MIPGEWTQIDEYFREAEIAYLMRHGAPTKADIQMLRADVLPSTSEPLEPEPATQWACWEPGCPRVFDSWGGMNLHYQAGHVRARRQQRLRDAS